MLKNLLRVLISLAFLGLLFYLMRNDMPHILQALKNVQKPLFLSLILIFLVTVVILAKRLQLIFMAEDVKITLLETCNLTFVGYFFNNFLPTSVGGDIVKAMCAARVTKEPVKSVTSVLMDRIFGLFTFILIPSLSFLFMANEIKSKVVPVIIYSFLVFSLLCFFLLFNRSLARRFSFVETLLNRVGLGQKVRKIYDGLHNFKNHKAVVAQAMLLSLIGQSISIFVLYGMAVALGANPSLLYFYLLVPVVNLISMLPSLNGLGIREGAYIFFLKSNIGTQNAAAIGILWLALLFLLSIIGGLIYLVRHDYHVRFKDILSKAEGAAV